MAERDLLADFDASIASEDPLNIAIRGHQAVGSMLDLAISDHLQGDHHLELERLSFSLKVDLAAGLGIIRPEARPIFLRLNKIRNDFAHDRTASFDTPAALDLMNLWMPETKRHLTEETGDDYAGDPLLILRQSLALAFVEAQSSVTRNRDAILRAQIAHEMFLERNKPSKKVGTVTERAEARFTERKAKRESEGQF